MRPQKTKPEPWHLRCTRRLPIVSKVDFSEEINEGDHSEEESDLADTLTQSAVQISFVDEDKITVAGSASSASATG